MDEGKETDEKELISPDDSYLRGNIYSPFSPTVDWFSNDFAIASPYRNASPILQSPVHETVRVSAEQNRRCLEKAQPQNEMRTTNIIEIRPFESMSNIDDCVSKLNSAFSNEK